MANKIEASKIFDAIGHLGKGQLFYVLPLYLANNVFFASLVLTPTFTCYFPDKNGTNTTDLSSIAEFESFATEFYPDNADFYTETDQVWMMKTYGSLFSMMFTGFLLDKFGRRKMIICCQLISIFFVIATLFNDDWQVYAWLEFARNFTGTGIFLGTLSYIFEMVGPGKWIYVMIITSGTWFVSYVFMVMTAQITGNWRYFTLVILGGNLPALYLNITGFESARWLVTQNRLEEATKIFKKIGRANGEKVDDLEVIQDFVEKTEKTQTKDQWFHLFTNLQVLFRVALLSICFFTQNFLYFGAMLQINKMSTENGSLYRTQYISAFTEFPQMVVPLIIVKLFGYRKSLIISAVVELIFLVPILLPTINLTEEPSDWIVLWIFAGMKAMSSIFWAIADPVQNQLIPTSIRSFANGFVKLWTQVSPIFATMMLKYIRNSEGSEAELIGWMFTFVTGMTLTAVFLLPKVDEKESPDQLDQIG